MSEYRTLFGKAVKAIASDPTDTGAEGQIWYNTTTGSFRTALATAAWSSGSNMITARKGLAGAGTQDAALAFGGTLGPVRSASTEAYNGSTWTASTNLTTARERLGGEGTQSSALAFGGADGGPSVATTEEFTGETFVLDYKTITTS